MTKINPITLFKVTLFFIFTSSFLTGQVIIAFEDFDGGSFQLSSNTNVFNYGSGGGASGDVFGRVNGQLSGTGMPFDVADDSAADVSGAMMGSAFPADELGIAGQNTSAFFAINDADAVAVNNAVWSFDISSANSISNIQIDLAAMGDFEASTTDGFLIEARIDAGIYDTIFIARTDEAGTKMYRAFDDGDVFSLVDPLELFVDGMITSLGYLDKCNPITGRFDTYTSYLLAGQTGSTLDIRVSWTGTPSGTEPIGIDNIVINGISLIHEVQGAGVASPEDGNTVTIEAIVVGDFQDDGMGTNGDLNGFFLQEEDVDIDANPLTSEGIFVFDGVMPSIDVNVGDKVRITAEVDEFFGLTELTNITELIILSSGNTLPTPASITFPVSNFLTNVNGLYIPDLEQYEGMLINVTNTMTITETFELDRYGEMLLTEGDRLIQFTQNNMPDATGYDLHLKDIAKKTIKLDDGLDIQNPDPILYPDGNLGSDDALRMGDEVSSLSGVLTFSRGFGGNGDQTYRLHPTSPPIFSATNPRPAGSPVVGGTLKVAGFNLLNFFTTLNNGMNICGPNQDQSCRGANNMDEYNRQLEKTVTALLGLEADIIGLIELENNVAADPALDGTDPVLEALVDAMNLIAGPGVYDFIDAGIIGSDPLKVGLIYKPAVVIPAPGTTIEILDNPDLAALGFGSYDPLFGIITANRNPLAVTFAQTADGEKLTVVVNHPKSKSAGGASGDDLDMNDGASAYNERRKRTIEVTNAWLNTDPTGSNDPDFLLVGDFNSYAQEDPIKLLESYGYTDVVRIFNPNPYSYVFDAQAATLDYAFASPSLVAQITGGAIWNINSDEADALDYNLDFGRNMAIFDGSIPFRTSDHDPVVVGLSLYMAPIPTMSEWGVFILLLLIFILGIIALKVTLLKSEKRIEI